MYRHFRAVQEPERPDFTVRSTSSRGIVTDAAYSGARATNPGGGAGSSMCSMTEPDLGQAVHVA